MNRLLDTLPPPLSRPLREVLAKNVHHWAVPWVLRAGRSLWGRAALEYARYRPLHHLVFCFCDHYEPEWGSPGPVLGEARVRRWQEGYPAAFSAFRDADGRPPQHTFFFPGEEYRRAYLDRLTELCARGFGELELHLHHSGDTAAALRDKIVRYLDILGGHGHFSRVAARDSRRGPYRYGFIHGNWALANAHKSGVDCGVDDELEVLFGTGCYADFTFPSAPHPTQPRVVNQIYWPVGDLSRPRSYEWGEPASVGFRHEDRLLMVEGPLALRLHPRRRFFLRIESSAITANDPPTRERVRSWVNQGICVRGRPEWIFVKVHTHGAPEKQAEAILGDGGRTLHRTLTTEYNDGIRWALHYVTARELYNIACAAMDGYDGDPAAFRDYYLPAPPLRAGTAQPGAQALIS